MKLQTFATALLLVFSFPLAAQATPTCYPQGLGLDPKKTSLPQCGYLQSMAVERIRDQAHARCLDREINMGGGIPQKKWTKANLIYREIEELCRLETSPQIFYGKRAR